MNMVMIMYMVIMLAAFVDGTPVFCTDVKLVTAMSMTQLMITIMQIVIHFFTYLYLKRQLLVTKEAYPIHVCKLLYGLVRFMECFHVCFQMCCL